MKKNDLLRALREFDDHDDIVVGDPDTGTYFPVCPASTELFKLHFRDTTGKEHLQYWDERLGLAKFLDAIREENARPAETPLVDVIYAGKMRVIKL
jgi:hypothetical protein